MTSGNARRVVLLDGTPSGDESLAPVLAMLRETLTDNGAEVQVFSLRDLKLAHCIGCFGCWIETPGICVQADAAREITAAIVHSEMLVLFTPVTFGGYSPELKVMVDRFVQLALPYFITHHGEMHHPPRYVPMPRFVAVGVQRQTDNEEATIFKILVGRNAINFHAPSQAAEVVSLGDDADAIRNRFQALLLKSDPYPLRDVVTSLAHYRKPRQLQPLAVPFGGLCSWWAAPRSSGQAHRAFSANISWSLSRGMAGKHSRGPSEQACGSKKSRRNCSPQLTPPTF